ncbi:competence type IV pilus minor pilin ComGG [Anoxybacteroides amylolyticum]|uniref:ComG operon 7 family protein n=1 Tax=Anoxybacteroides amylolyticum TaxID=294699 RepID=A0A167TGT7_9BACL|nr:competence type IV pilus minor pilin ComGG [Anoxybacillus amylolyticus]ANB60690.1 comG operon 7 family protein [Anoxybacillus amylolyticus]
MKRNEKGVIFPMTVMFSLLFCLAVFHALELYETEMQLADYVRQSSDVDSLMQMAVVDVKAQIAASARGKQSGKGTFTYPNGTVQYDWKQGTQNDIKVTLIAISSEGIQYSAQFTISFPSLELIEWKETYS